MIPKRERKSRKDDQPDSHRGGGGCDPPPQGEGKSGTGPGGTSIKGPDYTAKQIEFIDEELTKALTKAGVPQTTFDSGIDYGEGRWDLIASLSSRSKTVSIPFEISDDKKHKVFLTFAAILERRNPASMNHKTALIHAGFNFKPDEGETKEKTLDQFLVTLRRREGDLRRKLKPKSDVVSASSSKPTLIYHERGPAQPHKEEKSCGTRTATSSFDPNRVNILEPAFKRLAQVHNIDNVNGTKYTRLYKIGKGKFCRVYQVYKGNAQAMEKVDIPTSTVAIKKVNFDDSNKKQMKEACEREIDILKLLKGKPGIIELFDSQIVDDKVAYLVMEWGYEDLSKIIADMRENSKVKIHFVKHTCVQLLNIVRIVHNESIIHGDLKPQHFVTTSCNTFKLIDFGISARVGREGVVRYAGSVSGTLDYMGPECFTYVRKGRSKRVVEISMSLDLWSLGCIFYEMFVGYPPFFEFKDDQEKINAILEKDIEFSSISIPQANIRTAAIDFMKQCLNKDPEMRSSPESLIEHVFLCPN